MYLGLEVRNHKNHQRVGTWSSKPLGIIKDLKFKCPELYESSRIAGLKCETLGIAKGFEVWCSKTRGITEHLAFRQKWTTGPRSVALRPS